MRRKVVLAVAIVIVLGVIGLIWSALQPPDGPSLEANIINAQDFELPSIGFARVEGDYEWEFPRDLGPHPEFQREEWQLDSSDDGCPLQFSVVFNRVSILPQNLRPERSSEWAITSILNATVRVTNEGQTLIDLNRTSRVAVDLAGADDDRVWLENWSLNWQNEELTIKDNDVEIDLSLSLDEPETLSNSDGWYSYQQSGQASGEITVNGSEAIDCTMRLTHRFGS